MTPTATTSSHLGRHRERLVHRLARPRAPVRCTSVTASRAPRCRRPRRAGPPPRPGRGWSPAPARRRRCPSARAAGAGASPAARRRSARSRRGTPSRRRARRRTARPTRRPSGAGPPAGRPRAAAASSTLRRSAATVSAASMPRAAKPLNETWYDAVVATWAPARKKSRCAAATAPAARAAGRADQRSEDRSWPRASSWVASPPSRTTTPSPRACARAGWSGSRRTSPAHPAHAAPRTPVAPPGWPVRGHGERVGTPFHHERTTDERRIASTTPCPRTPWPRARRPATPAAGTVRAPEVADVADGAGDRGRRRHRGPRRRGHGRAGRRRDGLRGRPHPAAGGADAGGAHRLRRGGRVAGILASRAPPCKGGGGSPGSGGSLVQHAWSQEAQSVFSRIAIVNRGEAAMRLIHAVRELNAEGGGTDRDRRAATPTPSARRRSSARPTSPTPLGPASARPYLDLAVLERALRRDRRRRRLGRLGLRRRGPGVRRAVRPARRHLHRPERRGDAQARRQDRLQAASPRRSACRSRRGAAAPVDDPRGRAGGAPTRSATR